MNDPRKNRPDSGQTGWGTLYVVSTPIGNLEDITLRALRMLKSVDVIAAENLTHTKGLCRHHEIETGLVSYRRENQKTSASSLIKKLRSGQDVALVTDAGTPGISDPGAYLINRAATQGIRVTPIPGPSAVIAALSVSGLPTEQFLFVGFLPNRPGKRKKALSELQSESRTMVFFEAPHRVEAMLTDLMEVLGDRETVMVREMTKVFEEVRRGPVSHILAAFEPEKIKGEFTLVVAGREEKADPDDISETVRHKVDRLLSDNTMSIRDMATLLSKEEGVAFRRIYKAVLERKRQLEGLERHGAGQDI
jgi:16S rRNA (cytidine1402-2'-O)-methyltransferase